MSPSVSTRLLLTQSDARLVELSREGHERAFEALVLRHRRALLGCCRRLLLPTERAEDALQQGLLRAWLALQDGAEVHQPKAWLFTVVHRTALNMRRVSGYDYLTLSETLSGSDAPEEDLDRRIAVREALAGLAALPEIQREALLRTAVDGRSHEQVALALGVSEGAVRGLVYRARSALRAAATALTPSPVLSWALSQRGAGATPLAVRLAELGAGGGSIGGSIGVSGLLAKGGAAVVTAGALAGGLTGVNHSHAISAAHADRPRPAHATTTASDVAQPTGRTVATYADRRAGASTRAPSRAGTRAHARARHSPSLTWIERPAPVEHGEPEGFSDAGHGDRPPASTSGSKDHSKDGSSESRSTLDDSKEGSGGSVASSGEQSSSTSDSGGDSNSKDGSGSIESPATPSPTAGSATTDSNQSYSFGG